MATASRRDGYSLDVPDGRVTGLVGPNGPNGAGKSTVARSSHGFANIFSGSISIGLEPRFIDTPLANPDVGKLFLGG